MISAPRRERILTTKFDGGVFVTIPAQECMAWMTGGGGYWLPFGPGYEDIQIERQVADGIDERAARAFVRAMADGGCTDAEALGVIRDRDCARHGTAHELIDMSELPDRWFRDAWRRSPNGGPIYTDMHKAREIQSRHVMRALMRRKAEYKPGLWKPRLRRAKTLEELRAIMPRTV